MVRLHGVGGLSNLFASISSSGLPSGVFQESPSRGLVPDYPLPMISCLEGADGGERARPWIISLLQGRIP